MTMQNFTIKTTTVNLLLVLIFPCSLSAQNLVKNSGFEQKRKNPNRSIVMDDIGLPFFATGWGKICTVDHFQASSNPDSSEYDNQLSNDTNKSWCGLITQMQGNNWGIKEKSYREYITAPLCQPLVPGRKYIVRLQYAHASWVKYASNGLGIATSDTIILRTGPELCHPYPANPLIYLKNVFIQETSEWQKLETTFTAKGGEKYIIIGNFLSVKKTKKKKIRERNSEDLFAYYYIDNVELYPATESLEHANPCYEEIQEIVLHDLNFRPNEAVIPRESFKMLDSIANYLYGKELRLHVIGHTDSVGDFNFNMKLSEARAQAVSDYLISKGINPAYIKTEGMGLTKPIDSNSTAEGRQKNRRVTIEIRLVH